MFVNFLNIRINMLKFSKCKNILPATILDLFSILFSVGYVDKW